MVAGWGWVEGGTEGWLWYMEGEGVELKGVGGDWGGGERTEGWLWLEGDGEWGVGVELMGGWKGGRGADLKIFGQSNW